MNIILNDKHQIMAIQEEFNKLFPYLRLEFFTEPGRGAGPKKAAPHLGKTLGDCRTIHHRGKVIVVPAMTLASLEQAFREVYGLAVQVLRKSGKAWLETTVTDGWTLEEQNRRGEALSKVTV